MVVQDETQEADGPLRGCVCHVKSLDFILMAVREPWKAFKKGSDTLKIPVLDVSQLAGNTEYSRGIYGTGEGSLPPGI